MNAAERLWRGIARRDGAAIAAQFNERALILWPHTGERLGPEEYVTRVRMAGKRQVRVRRVVAEEEQVALEAIVDGRVVGCFYDLQQGRIAAGVEIFS